MRIGLRLLGCALVGAGSLVACALAACADRTAEPRPGELRISEVVSSNPSDGAPAGCDELGECEDWIELESTVDRPLELSGLWLSDRVEDAFVHQLSRHRPLPLSPRGRLVLFADGETAEGPRHLPFKLSKVGESLVLSTPHGTLLDRVDVPPLSSGQSYATVGGQRIVCHSPTPGAPDACAPAPARVRHEE